VAAGEPGVYRALGLLKEEVDRDMALLGTRSIAEITPELVCRLDGQTTGPRGAPS
jgi:L-lactate dehydrogenase (cytochrome)